VSGHDFSRAANAANSTWALQALEKLPRSPDKCQGTTLVVPKKRIKSTRASAPEGCILPAHLKIQTFFRSQLDPPRHVLPSFPRPTPNPKWKESLETPPPPAMHPHQALLHGDCFTLRNLPRAAGVHRGEFVSPAFHRLLRNCHRGLSLRGIESLSARVSGRHRLAPVARLGLPERQNIPSPLQWAKEKNCSRNTQFCNSLCGSG
jgi:hypothetical protein